MKIKALITTFVLGSSSVAMARPVSPDFVRDHRAPVEDDCNDEQPLPPPPPVRTRWNKVNWNNGGYYNQGGYYHQPAPMMIGSGLHLANDGRTFITVGLDKGRFTTLRLDGFTGRTLIQQVAIEFEGGQVQVARSLNRIIDGSRPLMLDLDGGARRIVRVVVYGQAQNGYGYGYRGREAGTFSASLL
jgi:hypothetical protein